MQIVEAVLNPILELIAPKTPPGSALFIVLVAFGTSVFSTLISRRFIDLKKLKLYTRKTKEYSRLQRKALRSQDPVLKKKLENQASTNQRMQSDLAKMRFKPLLYTMLPLILIFFALSSYYNTTSDQPDSLVGNIPFSLPETVLFFHVGINCEDTRNVMVAEYGTSDLAKLQADHNVNLSSLTGTQKLCLQSENQHLHYVPTYIGWYIFVNVIVNGVITKVAGLTPE